MPGQRKSALKGPRYFVSPEVQGSVCCKQAAIHCNGWRSSSASGWYSGVVEDGTRRLVDGSVQLCVRFIALVAKLELSANANPSFFKSVFVPILTGDYESSKDWKNTIPWPSESGSDGFLRWVHGVTPQQSSQLRNSCKALNFEHGMVFPLVLRIERSQLTLVRPYVQNVPGKINEATPAGYIRGKAVQKSPKDQVEWLHLQPCLIQSSCGVGLVYSDNG